MIFRLDGVTKTYGRGGHRALHDVSLEVRAGAIGLLGPNGAGKSTLIKALLGLVRLTSGNAEVLGHDVRKEALRIREKAGYMPEDDCYIAGLAGVEAVALSGQCAGMPWQTALRRAHEVLDYVRLDEARYREVQTYSTGMKARVRMATALVHSPKLVFFDEPTSGMDPEGREQILALVRDLTNNKGVSVVISTHILHDVEECCDSVMILAKGELLVYDALATLQESQDTSVGVRVGSTADADALDAALRNSGSAPLSIERTQRDRLRIDGDPEHLQERLASAAKASGVPLREIVPARNSLEDIFLRALRTDGGTDDANP